MQLDRKILTWAIFIVATTVPIALVATSPLLAWRGPIYIAAGFAGAIALSLLLVQPFLIGRYLPGLSAHRARRFHRWIGAALLVTVSLHVGGLWITSPPDVVDALLFVSPTPFSNWGVIAMWALFATTLLAVLRRRLRLRPKSWRFAHISLVIVIITGTVVHAVLIEGTMETVSKALLCGLVVAACIKVIADQISSSDRKAESKRTRD